MSRKKNPELFTNGGAIADVITPKQQLRRVVMSTMLWEPNAYESGAEVAKNIQTTVKLVPPSYAMKVAVEAKDKMYLRHVPLWVAANMATLSPGNLKNQSDYHPDWNQTGVTSSLIEETIFNTIQRPDEIGEFISLYQTIHGKKVPLAASVKRGISRAFNKFDAYQLGKWNQDSAKVKLRDALRMVHPKPDNLIQSDLFKKIMEGTLEVPDTWEKQLSTGKNKKDVFEDLLKTKKLGGLATLRNLRNMISAGVDLNLIKERLENGTFKKVLPFTFITAYNILNSYCPQLIPSLEKAMYKSLKDIEKLPGKTALVVDLSGSMGSRLSGNSELSGYDSAIALSMLAKEVCEEVVIFATAGSDSRGTHSTALVNDLSGFKLLNEIQRQRMKLGGGGIFLVQCLDWIQQNHKDQYSRVIVFTDEQDTDRKANPANAPKLGIENYIVNISSNRNGIGYKNGWNHIDGFSERIFDYITESEK